MHIGPARLDTGDPVFVAVFQVDKIASKAVGLQKRSPIVAECLAGFREREPADAGMCAIDLAILVLDLHHAPFVSARQL